MSLSKGPPYHGTLLALKRQAMDWSLKNEWNFSSSLTFFSHFTAAVNVEPLSE